MFLATRTLQICLLVYFLALSSIASASQVRLSTTDGLGSSDHWTDVPEVAFNAVRNEFLVVWTASDDGNGQDPSEWELFARRLSAETGLPISPQYRLTFFGDADDTTDRPDEPFLAYNPDLDEYLLVFEGKLNGEKDRENRFGRATWGSVQAPSTPNRPPSQCTRARAPRSRSGPATTMVTAW